MIVNLIRIRLTLFQLFIGKYIADSQNEITLFQYSRWIPIRNDLVKIYTISREQ